MENLSLTCSDQTLALFYALVKVQIGDGANWLFWTNRWMERDSVQSIAPDLLEFIPLKIMDSRTLAQALLNDSWIDDNVGGLSSPAIAQMLLLALVADLVQLAPGMPDHFCWAWEPGASFSVLLAYRVNYGHFTSSFGVPALLSSSSSLLGKLLSIAAGLGSGGSAMALLMMTLALCALGVWSCCITRSSNVALAPSLVRAGPSIM